jgi:hypothetical protein
MMEPNERDETNPGPGRPARDEYLWDRSGEPDPTVSALEGALAPHRWQGRLPDLAALDAATAGEDTGEDAGAGTGAGAGAGAGAGVGARRVGWPRALAAALLVTALLAVGLSVWRGIAAPRGDGAAGDRPPVAEAPAHDPSPTPAPVADARPYRLQVLDGTPRLDGAAASGDAPVAVGPGAAVETDARSRARVHVGDIGSVELGPASRLRVGEPSPDEAPDAGYLLHLDRGTLTASIFAAPRLFQLGTPSGIAVDMGCVYTAHVDEAGATRLHVELGQVSFETERRQVLVPSGASARAWPAAGPGTPVWDDAPPAWRAAVERHDERTLRDGAASDPEGLARVLDVARPEDTLTLWHLLAHARGEEGAAVYEALAALSPPPEGVTRQACLAGDRQALLGWRDVMGWAWVTTAGGKSGR